MINDFLNHREHREHREKDRERQERTAKGHEWTRMNARKTKDNLATDEHG